RTGGGRMGRVDVFRTIRWSAILRRYKPRLAVEWGGLKIGFTTHPFAIAAIDVRRRASRRTPRMQLVVKLIANSAVDTMARIGVQTASAGDPFLGCLKQAPLDPL